MDKALGYLGLCAKSGLLETGADNCIKALAAGKAKLILLAADASDNAQKRGEGMTHGRKTPLLAIPYTKEQVAEATGRDGPVALAAICDDGLAKAFRKAVQGTERSEEE